MIEHPGEVLLTAGGAEEHTRPPEWPRLCPPGLEQNCTLTEREADESG